jgi:hypothetical protein
VYSTAVLAWWWTLSAVSVINIAVWLRMRASLLRQRGAIPDAQYAEQRQQLVLAGIFTFVCAFRSFLPRADVQRICLVDSWLSTVLVGRSVATIAELAFMAQVAATVRNIGRHLGWRPAVVVSRAILPMIAIAECFSWYAVLTTNFLGNALEQSIWTLTPFIVAILFARMAFLSTGALRRFQLAAVGLTLGHVVFMSLVDVPMYVRRWLADEAAGRTYIGAGEALHDLATRWVVTFSWSDWHEELAWMGLYFSLAVWMSLAMVQAPKLWWGEGDL